MYNNNAVQSLYNSPGYNTDFDIITQSCGSNFFHTLDIGLDKQKISA